MKIGSTRNIVILEDFISKEERDFVVNSARTNTSITWGSNSQSGMEDKVTNYLHQQDAQSYNILKAAIDRTQKEIELFFGRPLEEGFPGIRRWDAGDYQPLHADGEDIEGHPNEAYMVDYGSVLYLNDDYTGGEIYFPDHNIAFKPDAGTLVFFPSNNMYNHGVREITSGSRYTSAQFWIPEKHKKLEAFIKGMR